MENYYVTGYFNDLSLNFYNENGFIDLSLNKTGSDDDIYIAKYLSNGTLSWGRRIGGSKNDAPISIVTDNTHVFITGYFDGSLNFYNKNGNIDLSLNKTGTDHDIFIAKYHSNGTFLWARKIGGEQTDLPVSIVTDNTNIYITGYFNGTALNFYNEYGNIDMSLNQTSSYKDVYIAKYHTNGTFLWAKRIGGIGNEFAISIVTDNTNLYITGYFSSENLTFYNNSGVTDILLSRKGKSEDTYIAKYNQEGICLWAKRIGGGGKDRPVSIVTNNTNIFITGTFDGSLNFYKGNGDIDISFNKTINDVSYNDTYIGNYDSSNGNVLWATQIGGTNSDLPISIVTDSKNVYITGYYDSSTLTFYNKYKNIHVSFNKNGGIEGNNSSYIAKYEPDGNIAWIRRIEGLSNNKPISVCMTTIQNAISNICFLKGTPVVTDQGIIEIQDITNKNTINNIKVKYITQTTTNDEYLISIEKDTICENVPSQRTVITKNHEIFYNGNLVKAETIPNTKINYNGEILYNVLLEENGLIFVNNLICETLDIHNVISLIYDHPNKNGINKTLNSIINTGNMELYKKTAIELLC